MSLPAISPDVVLSLIIVLLLLSPLFLLLLFFEFRFITNRTVKPAATSPIMPRIICVVLSDKSIGFYVKINFFRVNKGSKIGKIPDKKGAVNRPFFVGL